MEKSCLLGTMFTCLFVLVTNTTNAAVLPLEGRLPATPGGTNYQAHYDPNLDITWAADSFMSGLGTWDEHMAWAAGLTIGGVSGWRLPSADVNGDGTVVDCFGGGVSGCADNEMGYLYWEEGITASISSYYWSGTVYLGPPSGVWDFAFGDGSQTIRAPNNVEFAWAVRTGDVPVPAAIWLFGSGLLGLIGIARRKAA